MRLEDPKIVIAGAGSIGCYVGGRLLQAGRNVTFLGRDRIQRELREHGLTLTSFDESEVLLSPDQINVSTEPSVLSQADLILVTVKSGATPIIAEEVAKHASTDAIIVSLQNGVTNAQKLQDGVGQRRVVAGMVPFNVIQMGEGRFHQGTSGALVVGSGVPGLTDTLAASPMEIEDSDDMASVMWGKLLLNLNNALNALSDLPLLEQLQDGKWRRLLADQMSETLGILKAAGITPKSALPLPPSALPVLMRLPTPLFKIVAARMLDIDPLARSSMWEDLQQSRMTEIAELQGAVISLAEQHGRTAPICSRISELIRDAEQAKAGSPALSVSAIRSGLS